MGAFALHWFPLSRRAEYFTLRAQLALLTVSICPLGPISPMCGLLIAAHFADRSFTATPVNSREKQNWTVHACRPPSDSSTIRSPMVSCRGTLCLRTRRLLAWEFYRS